MKRSMICPRCHRDFPGEEFCPDHGDRLRTAMAAPRPGEPAPGPSESETKPSVEKAPIKPGLASRLGQLGSKLFNTGSDRGEQAAAFQLPSEISDWQVDPSAALERDAEATWHKVTGPAGQSGRYKRYASASLTNSSVYEQIQALPQSPFFGRLLAFGVHEGQTYELVEVGRDGTRFHQWIHQEVNEAAAIWFIKQSSQALAWIAGQQLVPVWLEPASFHLDGQGLKLTDFGKLVHTQKASCGFIPVLPPSRPEYAAPEVLKSKTWHVNSSLYSLGCIAMQMTTGHAPTHSATECGDLDFAKVQDARLQQALMGLLHPDPTQRWQSHQLQTWCNGSLVDAPDWSHLRPGAARTAFVMHGRNIFVPTHLAVALLEDLDLSAERIDDALAWLQSIPTQVDVVNEIARHRRSGRTMDWLILRLAHLLAPDAPRIWRGVSLDEGDVERNLIELGRRASQGDQASMALVDRLDAAQLKGVFSHHAQGATA